MATITSEQNVSAPPAVGATLPRFLFGPVAAVAIVALAAGWPNDGWPFCILWTVIASYGLFCWTSCFHEAAHHTLCGSRRFSVIVGRILGTMMFTPFHAYRESHIRHHAYLNKPSDWELWPYSDPNASLWFRRFYCWLEIPFGIVTSPYVYARLYFHRNSPLKDQAVRRKIRNEYIAMAVAWSLILAGVAYASVWREFIIAWVIPHFIAGFCQTVRKFTEHLGMASYDPLLGTRTVIGSGWITRLCTYFNFDIFVHGPHHRHPRYRHEKLCERMAQYQTENPEFEYPVFRTYLGAIADVLSAMVFNPGVGVNAGASPPASERPHDISDFGDDVTAEILNRDDAVVGSSVHD